MALPTGDSTALLQLIFDHAGEGISVFDRDMRLVAFNQRFLDCTGLSDRQAVLGLPLLDLLRCMAQAGEFGPLADTAAQEAECLRRWHELRVGPPMLTQRLRPNGQTLELRRTPTPDGGFVMLYADISQRRAAEVSLQHQQRMLDLVQQTTAQGFWFFDSDLRTTDANPAMCRMLATTRPALLGRSIWEFLDDAQAEVVRHNLALRSQGVCNGYEVSLVRSDGQRVHCFNNATPLVDDDGRQVGVLGLFSDVGPLKQAQAGLRQASKLLAQKSQVLAVTLDSLAQGVLSVDAQGNITAWNRRCLELLQVPESFMQTRPSFAALEQWQADAGLIPRDAPRTARDALPGRRVRADGVVLLVQTHVIADGGVQGGMDGGVVRTYTDITASAQAEQALRESESRFRTLADGAPALIWQCDAAYRASWFNQRWLQITGRSLEQELALPWAQRMHADDVEHCRQVLYRAGLEQRSYHVEYRLATGGPATVWIEDHGVPRFGSDGAFDGYVVYGWDITTRREAEAALVKAKEEAERANRAKSEFLSRMSHELRTPLNAVLGFAQLLESDPHDPLSPLQNARVQEMLRGGHHLLALINDVLDLSRIEAGALDLRLRPVSLPELVGDCLRLVAPAADERRIALVVQPGRSALCRVMADATRLRQVLLNLLANAVKYTPVGGCVTSGWQLSDDGQHVRLVVQDTGPGLSSEQQLRLFQPFERLDAKHGGVEGAGIGLALSKWLVSLMQGDMGVQSLPGQGCSFWVQLAHADAVPSDWGGLQDGAQPATAPPRHSTVLYIEDNPVNQVLMEGMLAHRPGVRLLTAGLPETGLSMALQSQPELVLLDIQLPGMDGFEVLRRLRAQASTRHIPVVAVSANAMPADLLQAREAGFDDYITKPIELQLLLATVARVLDAPGPGKRVR